MVANSHPTHVGKYRHFQLEIHGFNNNNKSLEIHQDAPDRPQPPILDQKKPTVPSPTATTSYQCPMLHLLEALHLFIQKDGWRNETWV